MCPLCKIIAVKYKHLVIGGTFDLLHKGHEKFLAHAFKSANRVTIGLTSDAMALKKGSLYQNYKVRRTEIIKFLKSKKIKNWQISKIDNPFGSATDDKTMDAILVSAETVKGAREINRLRKSTGLTPLKIILFEIVAAGDGKKISSGRIKSGAINRDGISFFEILTQADEFILPETLRSELAKPLGRLYENVETYAKTNNSGKLFVVGDASVVNFLKLGIMPNLSVVDFKIQRKKVYKKIQDLGFKEGSLYETVSNRPGEITKGLVEAIYKNISGNNRIIKVNGEEDLAVLPVILLAPLKSLVVYGQKRQGVVAIEVDEKSKEKFLSYLQLFDKQGDEVA